MILNLTELGSQVPRNLESPSQKRLHDGYKLQTNYKMVKLDMYNGKHWSFFNIEIFFTVAVVNLGEVEKWKSKLVEGIDKKKGYHFVF